MLYSCCFCCVHSQTARRKSVATSSTFATSRRRKSTSKDSEPSASVSRAERWICNRSACVVGVSVVCEMWCVSEWLLHVSVLCGVWMSECCVCVSECCMYVCVLYGVWVSVAWVCEWVLPVCVCVTWCVWVSAVACQQLNELVSVWWVWKKRERGICRRL